MNSRKQDTTAHRAAEVPASAGIAFLKAVAAGLASQFNSPRCKATKGSGSSAAFEPLEDRQLMSASTLSAVSFEQQQYQTVRVGAFTVASIVNVPTTAVFSIGANNNVFESTGPGNNTNLGGNMTQISAGLDTSGKPEVYGIASDDSVLVNDNGAGWSLLGTATQISASVNGTVYAIAPGGNVCVSKGSAFSSLGRQATQISAGVDLAGQPEVYAIQGSSGSAAVNFGVGWVTLAGSIGLKQISGSINDTVYGIDQNNAVWVDTRTAVGGTGWSSLAGQVTQISAGLDTAGKPEVFAIGNQGHAFVNDGNSSNAWRHMGRGSVHGL